jgi:hypothetical protein
VIVLLAAVLRLTALDAGWFGVDQARDLAWAERIASGAGHPVAGPLMRNRFHLGALYYEFWALPAYLTDGPHAAYAFAGLLGVLAVYLTWRLARRIAGPRGALAAAALLAAAPLAVIDARVAWAPAALPAWSAVLLLCATSFARVRSTARAAALLFVAALGTQLHVAAGPLALVAGMLVLVQARALRARGLALAGVAGLLPLLPMLAALAEPVPAIAAPPILVDPREHRLGDFLLLVPRVLTGLTPAPSPLLVRAWLPCEAVLGGATLAAALVLLVRPPRQVDARAVRIVAAFFWSGVVAVLLLPADAWYYYLDMTLVPAAVLLGIAGASLGSAGFVRARLLVGALVVVLLARTALLAWWIGLAAASGYVSANLDWLHLGGARSAAPDARARLLSVATKAAAADALVRDASIPLDRLWRDVHGSGFSDLDNDNGYFFTRAARGIAASSTATAGSGRSALVSYPGELPSEWLVGFSPPQRVGPLEIRTYAPTLEPAAELRGCAGTLPVSPRPEPLAYGAGLPPWPTWPCATPTVVARALPAPASAVVRVLARVDGAARIASVVADPPSATLAPDAAGAGIGVEVPSAGGEISVHLDVSGPARLDLYELHGLR